MKQLCQACKGEGHVTVKMKDRAGRNNHSCGNLGVVVCPACGGKGRITNEDRNRV